MAIALGYNALVTRFNLAVPPLRQTFWLGARAAETRTQAPDGTERIELPRGRVSAEQSTVEQLTFALKREHLNLTVLGALFEHRPVLADIQAWLNSRPTSGYARRAGYLAHWLAGADFEYRAPAGSPRVRLLNADDYLVGPEMSSPQFAVVNNLLGSREFSPLVRKTGTLCGLLAEDLRAKVARAMDAIEPEMLSRAVDYLYLSETRSTYGIEDEVPDSSRAAKFRHLLEMAGEPGVFDEEKLCEWQNLIVTPLSAESSYRTAQNWLSRPGRLRNMADFIPPPRRASGADDGSRWPGGGVCDGRHARPNGGCDLRGLRPGLRASVLRWKRAVAPLSAAPCFAPVGLHAGGCGAAHFGTHAEAAGPLLVVVEVLFEASH